MTAIAAHDTAKDSASVEGFNPDASEPGAPGKRRPIIAPSIRRGARATAPGPGAGVPAEVLFVDPNAPDLATILGATSGARRRRDHALDGRRSQRRRQMAEALARRDDLDAVHVIAHGAPGRQ